MEIINHLNDSLERLFLDKNDLGFWDSSQNRIIEYLWHDEKFNWSYRPNNNYRYSLFCLSFLLLAKEIYGLKTEKYDEKIIKFLHKVKINFSNFSFSDKTYGAYLSLIIGEKIYKISLIDKEILSQFFNSLSILLKTIDNQNFLLLISAYYFNQMYTSSKIEYLIKRVQNRLINSVNRRYFFDTGDLRATYHQRIMYTLWGLIFSSSFGNYDKIRSLSINFIDGFYANRRFEDNAFVFHPSVYSIHYSWIRLPIFSIKSSKYLYECHQTFYANSINFYRYFFKEFDAFNKEKKDSIEWIFGGNRNKENLTYLTGISLPARIMDLNGNYFIKNENFKGSYEIGSYILALSSFNIPG